MARRSHYPWGAALALGALCGARALRGEWVAAAHTLDALVAPGEVFEDAGPALHFLVQVYRQLLAARQDKLRAGEPLAVGFLASSAEAKPDPQTLSALCAGAETALRRGDLELAARCCEPLAQASASGIAFTTGWIFLVPRVIAAVAVARGDRERAERCLDAADELATRSGARAERALVLLERARLLARNGAEGDRQRAGEVLREAGSLFESAGMAPFEEEAIELASQLGIRLAPAAGYAIPAREEGSVRDAALAVPENLTLMVTDIVGSTALLERLGEERAQELVHTHNAMLRACLRAYRGREIQHTGDGMIAAFRSAGGAVRCAIALQQDLAQQNARSPEAALRVRIGLHAGEVRPEETRVFGAAVNATVRICACADAGRILVSDAVREQLAEGLFALRERGPAHLKGFTQPFHLHEVEWGTIRNAD